MTDREKLVELLKNHPCNSKMCTYCKEMKTCNFYEKSADHLIANGVTFATDKNDGDKWIPATERMPKPMKFVLCACRANIIEVMRYDTKRAGWDPMSEDRLYMKGFVTHWMPLPEPPKE